MVVPGSFVPPPFHPGRPMLVRPVRTDPAGERGPTRRQARGPAWRRTSRGFYVPSDVDSAVPEQRIVEASAVMSSHAAVTGWPALRWLGGSWFGGLARDGSTPLPVPLVISTFDIRPQPGFALSGEGLSPREVMVVDNLAITIPVRSACFEARYADDVRDAVVALDMTFYSDLASRAEVSLYAARLNGWTGVPRLREALALVDENSWSPQEVRSRLVWELDAGLPHPLCNAPIFDRGGRHIVTPDLLDPEVGLVAEYDGALHLEGRQRRRDRDRLELYRAHGLEAVIIFAGDLADRDRLARRIREAHRRCRREAESRRTWTTEPPARWIPTVTVDQRRALDARQRERLLRLRLKTG